MFSKPKEVKTAIELARTRQDLQHLVWENPVFTETKDEVWIKGWVKVPRSLINAELEKGRKAGEAAE